MRYHDSGAYLTGDDGVVHAGRGPTFIGDLDNQHPGLAEFLAALLSEAGFPATAVGDIRSRLWQKLAVNAVINPWWRCMACAMGNFVVMPTRAVWLPW
ncbi:hypothetical protein HAALTHF_34280n [Vreelandella aquamarina]|nr:hypothetical protein HAALTHF_34280n [Halomonas axialensis]